MKKTEKKIVQTIAWLVSIGIGLKVAEQIYDISMIGYMRTFHKDEYKKAIENILKEKA